MSWRQSSRLTEKRRNTNPALQGAYAKGARARRNGQGIETNPYHDDGKGTGFRRAFRTAWDRGWSDAG